jgi:hypothetical protein
MRDTGWFKSTYSSPASDNCVEVRITDLATRVRDSKNPAGGHLALDRKTFAAFVASLGTVR